MLRWKLLVLGTALLLVGLSVLLAGPTARAGIHGYSTSMYVTFYGFDDNTPAGTGIAYQKNEGYPTVHNQATEGKGTYHDPITLATSKSELAIGTIVYVPFLEKYFIMEDECSVCDSDWSKQHKYHVDLWMGPQAPSPKPALNSCEDALTRDFTTIVVNPANNLKVDTIPLFTGGKCTAHIH